MKIIVFTASALIAFVLNSILCQVAVGSETIDAVGFTKIRLVSGAVSIFD